MAPFEPCTRPSDYLTVRLRCHPNAYKIFSCMHNASLKPQNMIYPLTYACVRRPCPYMPTWLQEDEEREKREEELRERMKKEHKKNIEVI